MLFKTADLLNIPFSFPPIENGRANVLCGSKAAVTLFCNNCIILLYSKFISGDQVFPVEIICLKLTSRSCKGSVAIKNYGIAIKRSYLK